MRPEQIMKRGISFGVYALSILLSVLTIIPVSAGSNVVSRPVRMAIMAPLDISNGWVALSPEAGLRRGCGELLIEALADLPEFAVADWSVTCGLADLVANGLYRFKGDASYAEWSKLYSADIFADYTITADEMRIAVHSPAGTETKSIVQPLTHPKEAASTLIRMVFKAAAYPVSESLDSELADPETKIQGLLLEWMRWIGYRPSPYNGDDPYGLPNRTAAEILKRDPEFHRGVAWALQMSLKPVASGKPGKTRLANPDGFDLRILEVLDYKRADFLVPDLRVRLAASSWLRQQAADIFVISDVDKDLSDLLKTEGFDATWNVLESGPTAPKQPATIRVRLRVIQALRGMNQPDLVRILTQVEEKEADAGVRAAAAEALRAASSKPISSNVLAQVANDLDTARYIAGGRTPAERAVLMLADSSMRVNAAALRVIDTQPDAAAIPVLMDVVSTHPNDYIRVDALTRLAQRAPDTARAACRTALDDPYWTVRLHAAAILGRLAAREEMSAVKAALDQNTDPWLKPALEDALARSTGSEVKRQRLELGVREHVEGGEVPNGWQSWLGTLPKDPAEARRLVSEGYRFGAKTSQPSDTRLWSLGAIDNHRGNRNVFLLELLKQLTDMRPNLPYLYYLCLFDEPMGPSGDDQKDSWRAFVLETGRPELLACEPSDAPVPDQRAFSYWRTKRVGDISNWVVGLCRDTVQREYPDLNIFPQTLSYMGLVNAFDTIDADGDYTWRYDRNNLFGDYGLGAVNRAMRPGKPVGKVTWLGGHAPAIIHLDSVFTDTTFPVGPWRFRNYMGVCSALALYTSGVEAGFFNHVAYASIGQRGQALPGRDTYSLTPWSDALHTTITAMMAGDQAYWNQRKWEFENEAAPGREDLLDRAMDDSADLPELQLDLEAPPTSVELKMEDLRQKHFTNAMIGCSYMNIFDTDVTRSLANLPRPDTSPRDTLVILSRGTRCFSDGATFIMPALAFLRGFDLAPSYDAVKSIDFTPYDTILLMDGGDGVTPELVTKVNAWLLSREKGLLYVAGDVNTKRVLFPNLTHAVLADRFAWEDEVQVAAVEDTRPAQKQADPLYAPIVQFVVEKKTQADSETQMRTTYGGTVTPLIVSDGKAVLARWIPKDGTCTVLFDGAANAGPIYTEVLERFLLAMDSERGTRVERNPYWGHVSLETPQFTIDVATRGYTTLQAARPRQHRGVDIITGVINPSVTHGEAALILKDYVGPYAGGRGDWAVMARSELKEMVLIDATHLRVHSRGVTRVTHIGPHMLRLQEAGRFKQVEDQLAVWQAHWRGEQAYAVNPVDGGMEFHYVSQKPVVVVAEDDSTSSEKMVSAIPPTLRARRRVAKAGRRW